MRCNLLKKGHNSYIYLQARCIDPSSTVLNGKNIHDREVRIVTFTPAVGLTDRKTTHSLTVCRARVFYLLRISVTRRRRVVLTRFLGMDIEMVKTILSQDDTKHYEWVEIDMKQ